MTEVERGVVAAGDRIRVRAAFVVGWPHIERGDEGTVERVKEVAANGLTMTWCTIEGEPEVALFPHEFEVVATPEASA